MRAEIDIVDFGSQTTDSIARRYRQLGIATQTLAPDKAFKAIMSKKPPAGLILSGGPASVYEEGAPKVDPRIFKSGIPTLAICYGWQLSADELGGEVLNCSREYGPAILAKQEDHPLLESVKMRSQVWMSHGDSVTRLPNGFRAIASTSQVENAVAVNDERQIYGVQFHPEVDPTTYGTQILRNFAETICGLEVKPMVLDPQRLIDGIREKVGEQRVVCGVSGGVDSTVAAFLIGKAIGENFIPVYVDNGLMRPGTEDQVRQIFPGLIQADLTVVPAKDRFMRALTRVTDPEKKRKRIGSLYTQIFREEGDKYQNANFLAQGTIYSDVIESRGSKHASNIKSHHNVGGLPRSILRRFKILEPLRNFYKDEVRELGRLAGLPASVLSEQPFPGPGYAIRIIGEVTEERLQQVTQADSIVIEEMKKAGLYDQVFQCFALMTGAYSTAVKGDAREHSEVVGVRLHSSEDVMTAQSVFLPETLMSTLMSRIVNEVPRVSRVVFDFNPKPPATMEWE